MTLQLKGWVTPVIVGVTSFAAGSVTGYFVRRYQVNHDLKNRVENYRAEVIDQDIRLEEVESSKDQMQFQFSENLERMNSVVQQANKVMINFVEAGKAMKTQTLEVVDMDPHANMTEEEVMDDARRNHPSLNNNFDGFEDDWDYAIEVPNRSETRPYIITRDEWDANELDFGRDTLTYYAGDNILCDDHDVPVYNYEKIVGNLLFGHGSEDPSIVYCRNHVMEQEWEILLEEGFYQTEVLGAEVEGKITQKSLRHSIHKFREED